MFNCFLFLSALNAGDKAILIRVKDSSNSFLAYLDRNEIALNSEILVKAKEQFDNSMLIEINNKQLTISNQITNNLFVQKVT